MKWKSYIAILFALIFFGKFLVMDSMILVTIFEPDEIVYVNPFCKKQNSKITEGASHETLNKDFNQLSITMDTFCNTPIKFEVYNWEYSIIPEKASLYAYHSPSLPDSNKDRFYPPPKV